MSKIGIITIYNSNYGNRLQNYALQESLKKLGHDVTTIKNVSLLNKRKNMLEYFLRNIKYIFKRNDFVDKKEREGLFQEFNKNINLTKYVFNWNSQKKLKDFDCFVIGSDQVWNPNIGRLTNYDLAHFSFRCNKISYAASIGVESLDEFYINRLSSGLKDFKAISLREDAGVKIVKEKCDLNCCLLVDPTMLLDYDEWSSVIKKPKQYKNEKYILNYFLGDLSEENEKIINEFAKKNNCKVINLLRCDDPFYETGPSEFLFLEKNAFMICTDSFHSSVFSILFNKPFVVFDRNQKGFNNMSSRIDTLLSKFKLEDRKFSNGNMLEDYLVYDYSESYAILNKEREKSFSFLKDNLE